MKRWWPTRRWCDPGIPGDDYRPYLFDLPFTEERLRYSDPTLFDDDILMICFPVVTFPDCYCVDAGIDDDIW